MLRLFVAVPLPDPVRDAVAGAIAPLRAGGADVGWGRPGTWHVTLRFLGDVAEEHVDGLAAAIDAALAPLSAVDGVVGGGGAFPSVRSPRVLWIGVEGPLAPIAVAVDRAVEASLGVPPEDRPWRAHLTVGRVRHGKASREAAAVAALGELGRFRVDEVVLYRSELSPKGATHTALRTFRLS